MNLSADAKQSIQVPANSTAVVRWPADVAAAGQALLRFNVDGGGLQDKVEQTLPIQRFTTLETVASAGQVQDTTVETIGSQPQLPNPQLPANGELDLELTPSLAAGVDSALGYLEHYPYYCSEQTVSRFLPNAVTYRLFKQLGMDDPQLKASLETNLTAGLQRLYALQHLDGGWGWWEDDDSQAYLSAYVVQGLVEAKKAGYAVDQDRLDKGVAYLESFLNADESSTQSAHSQFSILNSQCSQLHPLRPGRGRQARSRPRRGAVRQARAAEHLWPGLPADDAEIARRRGRPRARAGGQPDEHGHPARRRRALGGARARYLEHEQRHPQHRAGAPGAGARRPRATS